LRQDLRSPLAYPPLPNFVFLSPFFFLSAWDSLDLSHFTSFGSEYLGSSFSSFNLDSLPFRFKGSSANMAPTQTVHHHRNTTKVSHKPFKSKHASKSALKDQQKGQ
jgi:hypothetical protein